VVYADTLQEARYMRELSQTGLDLIKSFEGIADGDPTTVNLDPYLDPVGIWTIGWGHAIRVGKDFLRGKENKKQAFALYPGGITIPQAEALLRADVMDKCRDVQSLVKRQVNDNQFAALVSFAYNCGAANLEKSTLLRLVNAGDFAGAANEFPKWNKSQGKVLPGLTRRRAAEAELFQKAMAVAATV
jgi:lysozyme